MRKQNEVDPMLSPPGDEEVHQSLPQVSAEFSLPPLGDPSRLVDSSTLVVDAVGSNTHVRDCRKSEDSTEP